MDHGGHRGSERSNVLITGANSGLGEQTALALGSAGANVILACRTVAKAEPVAARIGSNASITELDLADLSSVRACAERTGPIDVLINNAGVMAIPKGRTVDGFETQIGTNHFGHFALTGLLLPEDRRPGGHRVIHDAQDRQDQPGRPE